MMSTLIKTDNLTVGYGKVKVVENVNFSVDAGEIVTLIGANGSGKSTLLKTLSGHIDALCGEIFFENERLRSIKKSEISRKMAVMFPQGKITESMTCSEVVALGRFPYTGFFGHLTKKDNEIIENMMLKTNVYDLRDCDFNKISDGQRQRVLLARALCQSPSLLLLDEPTTFLDIKYRLEFMSALVELAKSEKIGILMSIHELDMARQVSDRIICIKDKRIDKIGTPAEVFDGNYIDELFDIDREKICLQ